ncbi:MAG TPA: chemotaxis protein CheW [Phototrophicaceae bacterium]|nr:chemotaxis protein CheW [Phototrophicaceae bacterium]
MVETAWSAVLTFTLGAQIYGLSIEAVVEVAAMVELVQMPDAPPALLGMMNRRGVILPMLDLRQVFNQAVVAPISTTTLFIVAAHDQHMAGLVVDEIRQVEYVNLSQQTVTSGKYIHGIINHKGHLIQIIALPAILAAFLPQLAAIKGI